VVHACLVLLLTSPPPKKHTHTHLRPQDLSPLAQEEEEPWVPQMRRRVSQQRVAAAEVKAQLDYKNVDLLLGYVSASGRIKSRRQTRLPPSVHNRVARTVKFARHMALLPYEMRVGHDADAGRWKRQRSMAAAAAADKAERS
jgi:ribosomal protein S18